MVVISITTSCSHADIVEETTGTLPPDTEVKYDPQVQSIMFDHCITCHSGPAANAGLDLSTFQNVRASAQNGNLIQRMNNTASPMPPQGVLSPQVRQLMDKWVQDGFPEN